VDPSASHPLSSAPAGDARPANFFARRAWVAVRLALAAIVGWLVFCAYRQPEFLIDFVNLRLC
jgi:hypothetical protein